DGCRNSTAFTGGYNDIYINIGCKGKTLKNSDQTSETWPCVWPEDGADESAAHGSARNPKPACRVGPAAASIEVEGGRIIESVLAKYGETDSIGRNGRNGAAEALAQFSAPF